MKKNLLQMTFGLWMIYSGPGNAQNAIELEFYNCSNSPTSLCVTSPGVRLPDNNQSNLGENDPLSTSCSVHFSHQVELRSSCSQTFQYKIEVSYYDTSAYHEILSWTTGVVDAQDEATLTFDTEQATDDIVSNNGLPYTSGCFRYHRIKWTVEDMCGNVASCEKRFELYDCQGPVPVSSGGPTILNFHANYDLQTGLNELAGDYLDDCGSTAQFLFSTQSTSYKNDTLFHYCDVPVGVLVILPIWVADQGRDLNCDGIISWDERTKYQGSAPVIFIADGTQDCSNQDLFISGHVKTWQNGTGIAKTHVEAADANQSYPSVITDENGYFAFPHINFDYPVTVTPARNDGIKNGVSTLDLVQIQKHLLGIEKFTHPEQFIAADANNSAAISAIDLIVLRKLILGLVDTLPAGKSWVFYRSDYVFPNPIDPWQLPDTILPGGPDPDQFIIHNENETSNVDFNGIKLGDVNSTADPDFTSLETRSQLPSIVWTTDAVDYAKGDIVEIPIKCSSRELLTGFQFTIANADLDVIDIKAGIADISPEDFALMSNYTTVSWFTVFPISAKPGDILFTIVAKAKATENLRSTFSINSVFTNAEVYDEKDRIFTPKLEFSDPVQDHFILYSNVPNPWNEETTITFYLPVASNIKLNIYNTTGQIQSSLEQNFDEGQHEIVLSKKDFMQRGLLVYTLQNNKEVKIGKMIVSE